MNRRSPRPDHPRAPEQRCRYCQWMRMFLVCAGVLIASIGLNADWGLSDLLPEDHDLSSVAGDAILLVFLVTMLVKYLAWRRRRRSGLEPDDGLTWLGQSRRPASRNQQK